MGLLSWLFGKGENDKEKIARYQSHVATENNALNKHQKYIDRKRNSVNSIDRETRRLQSAAAKKSVALKRLKDKGLE